MRQIELSRKEASEGKREEGNKGKAKQDNEGKNKEACKGNVRKAQQDNVILNDICVHDRKKKVIDRQEDKTKKTVVSQS